MARGWGGSITTALGVAAGAGAAQLGFGYGLGIINWAPPSDGAAAATAWTASLIWATWIAATSTVLGAVCAQRLRARGAAGSDDTAGASVAGSLGGGSDSPTGEVDSAVGATPAGSSATGTVPTAVPGTAGTADARATRGADGGTLGRFTLAVAAGVGALITVLLVAVPARVAVVPDISAPRDVAAVYAALGVLVGVAIAVWALHSRAAAGNVIATVGWLWLLAVVAVVDGVLAGRGLTSAQLGIWQLSAGGDELWIRDWFYWPGALLSLGSALVIGILAARRAARDPDRRVGTTASGAAGPLLVAVAYLLAVPGLTAIGPEQVSAHLIAPYAVIVGLGGSALVATLGQRAGRRPAARVPRQRTAPESGAGPDEAGTGATGATGGRDTTGSSRDVVAGGAGGGDTLAESAPGGSTSAGDATGGTRRGRTTAARASGKKASVTDRLPTQRAGEIEQVDASAATTGTADATDGAGTTDEMSTRTAGRRARPPRRD
ncbi:hypothetical protein [Micromonospora thermarum]|uniref:hypothetical protein n=1 Tax=Micromonospora thermarum TaxID=2720024 RepID=UPI001F0FB8D8|nr:hypothetical protein [Micromonospora thermarum]